MDALTEMKFSKILYLTEVLEDIENEMSKDFRNRDFCKSIRGIVKDIRDVMDMGGLSVQAFDIKRLEVMRKCNDPYRMQGIASGREFEELLENDLQDDLLAHIKKNKLIRIRKHNDDDGIPVLYASLIVGIEKK